ncbi:MULTISPECIES: rRNA maturation RNase YbeY [unclassified Leeuwenhoekiella]|uniref:rRNA maturation RNase YbeY n=1 Tax=unclassified Leeuwenhoekiella TaxID=2615029 RepID=UPI000C6AEDBC|nr:MULTISPECIES: rRNA maturation RNase YbeY [unclassified Leeuwenhoekiella]MAW95995.1 rRNA maturation RNase YbeY [Leeuwenhoekiella sp.]MBA79989.1 rRNA maturation RNase YbeY [Leeuwenhoekiella sp.]|tara:strand:+ start:2531 stop:2950 length:420 start_codon:yes stop_codon:yes gene_type:complete
MIEFNSQNDFSLQEEDRIKLWLERIAQKESFQIDELGYVFCSDEYLLEINKQYLDHDTYTDIVTFDYSDNGVLNGELYISTERVEDNSKDFNVSFDTELRRVIAHGLLHMCGYGDKSVDEISVMRSKEEECLKLWEEGS